MGGLRDAFYTELAPPQRATPAGGEGGPGGEGDASVAPSPAPCVRTNRHRATATEEHPGDGGSLPPNRREGGRWGAPTKETPHPAAPRFPSTGAHARPCVSVKAARGRGKNDSPPRAPIQQRGGGGGLWGGGTRKRTLIFSKTMTSCSTFFCLRTSAFLFACVRAGMHALVERERISTEPGRALVGRASAHP